VKAVRYYVLQLGSEWEVSCSIRALPATRHPDRGSALQAAQQAALGQWQQQRVATEVLVNEGDAGWLPVASFGSVLDQ
jgi:hypothetical protein